MSISTPTAPSEGASPNGHAAGNGQAKPLTQSQPASNNEAKENKPTRPALTPPKTSLDTSSSKHSADPTNEFTGDIDTNNTIPSQALLKSIENFPVLDKDGKSRPFRSLYTGPNVHRRVLIIFVRHFFCGVSIPLFSIPILSITPKSSSYFPLLRLLQNHHDISKYLLTSPQNCQEYLRTLSASITPTSLLSLPLPTFIAIIGCGDPSLIPMYASATSCPFPIYADPSKQLYNALGMVRTLNLGPRPEYQRKGLAAHILQSIVQSIKQLPSGKTLKGGDYQQVGGEFLFEPIGDVFTSPICTPSPLPFSNGSDSDKQLGAGGSLTTEISKLDVEEEKRITWCHRMRNTRDHAEIPELREVLGLDGFGIPGKSEKRWEKAMGERKGTGFSKMGSGLKEEVVLEGRPESQSKEESTGVTV
jgi:hypothetical protein